MSHLSIEKPDGSLPPNDFNDAVLKSSNLRTVEAGFWAFHPFDFGFVALVLIESYSFDDDDPCLFVLAILRGLVADGCGIIPAVFCPSPCRSPSWIPFVNAH